MPEVRGSQNHRTLGPHVLCMATKVARVTEPTGWDIAMAPDDPWERGGPDILSFPRRRGTLAGPAGGTCGQSPSQSGQSGHHCGHIERPTLRATVGLEAEGPPAMYTLLPTACLMASR